MDTLYISHIVTPLELNNLKYLPSNTDIYIQFDNSSLLSLLNKINELNKNNRIIIKINYYNKENFNNFLYDNKLQNNNIYIDIGGDYLNINKYIDYENRLYQMLEPTENLTPFETYIYIYNLVKIFKKYNENEEDYSEARNLYKILDNEYIVCSGFSNLFGDLLNKVGIKNRPLFKYKDNKLHGHCRRYVNIIDEKYNINGFYVSDPTFDNELDNDYYNYLAITNIDEMKISPEYIPTNTELLLNTTSNEEFKTKIYDLLLKNININKIFIELINLINDLDYDDDKNFKEEYQKYYLSAFNTYKKREIFINNLSNYMINHINKKIPDEIIINAIREVLKKTTDLNEIQIEIKLYHIREYNKIRKQNIYNDALIKQKTR
jgi:hypothetical protein